MSTLSLPLSLVLSISLSLTHTLFTHSLSLSHTHTLSLSFSPAYTYQRVPWQTAIADMDDDMKSFYTEVHSLLECDTGGRPNSGVQ